MGWCFLAFPIYGAYDVNELKGVIALANKIDGAIASRLLDNSIIFIPLSIFLL